MKLGKLSEYWKLWKIEGYFGTDLGVLFVVHTHHQWQMQRQTYKYNEMRDTDIAVAFEHTTHVNSTNQWGTLNKVLSMNYYRDDLCFKSAFSKSKQSLFQMKFPLIWFELAKLYVFICRWTSNFKETGTFCHSHLWRYGHHIFLTSDHCVRLTPSAK